MTHPLTIYIPTHRRVDRQLTWSWLPEAAKAHTWLVATPDEAEGLDLLGYPVLACPASGIADTRQWIIDQHDVDRLGPVAWLIDDDLRFLVRRTDDPSKFRTPVKGSADVQRLVDDMAAMMQHVPMGGISDRSGANRVTDAYRRHIRIYDTWAINVATARQLGIRVNRLRFMEDFDTHLQFLTRGYDTLALNMYAKEDSASNVMGGCSVYRDAAGQREAAEQLHANWPEFVKLTERPGWKGMGETRLDVRVSWQKALEYGRAGRDLLGTPQEPSFSWPDGQLVVR